MVAALLESFVFLEAMYNNDNAHKIYIWDVSLNTLPQLRLNPMSGCGKE